MESELSRCSSDSRAGSTREPGLARWASHGDRHSWNACAVQTAWPVDAAGLRTTTRARPETACVRAVVARSPRTTALQMTGFASARLPAAPTGPATGRSFLGVLERRRERRTC